MIVDAAGSVGNWTSIKIDKTSSHPYYNKPIIAYYNATETGGRDTIKLAIANNVGGSVTDGIDPDTNYTSTGWEYMTVPSIDPAQVAIKSSNKFVLTLIVQENLLLVTLQQTSSSESN